MRLAGWQASLFLEKLCLLGRAQQLCSRRACLVTVCCLLPKTHPLCLGALPPGLPN